ncbi:LysR substrate-binding domain-containing protein [Streptomyces sp. NPDC087856]|uniref:LysR substrate-binding domain-containing protein n=1 Tax=Streptomyces sp. NPDC087856 TaxID=3365811 RepID=UPI0037FC7351
MPRSACPAAFGDNAATRVINLSAGERRRIVLGAIESMAVDSLPAAVKAMRSRRPHLVRELDKSHTEGLAEGFDTMRFDLVIVRGTIPEARDSSVLIHEDELVAVLPSAPGPTGAEVDLANRANKDFIVHNRQPTSVLTNITRSPCRRTDLVLHIWYESLGTELTLGLVAAHGGLALVSRAAPGSRIPRRPLRPAGGAAGDLERHLGMACPCLRAGDDRTGRAAHRGNGRGLAGAGTGHACSRRSRR